jgi:hypothetical protein
VKKSGRDEPMWVVLHMCIEATLGISPVFISNYQNHYVFLITSYVFFSTESESKRAEQVLPRTGRGLAQTMYTYVNKCKK